MSEQQNSLSVVTIQPPPSRDPGQAQLANGTKVILSDGSELSGVTAVTLKAVAGGLWEATISVRPSTIQPVTADACIVQVEVTDLADESRQYSQAVHE